MKRDGREGHEGVRVKRDKRRGKEKQRERCRKNIFYLIHLSCSALSPSTFGKLLLKNFEYSAIDGMLV